MNLQPSSARVTLPPEVRCAIYTRKSTEEGLDQEFNSLDAQREAAQAYIASQKHEGWICLPERFDDGGFTGGNMERPALQRLLAAIEAGHIHCVVVYKVDRLSRSLLDFAKMMETFDTRRISFVSVTQQFNTATSMGRLVLNVLLSFAQFEREIISERTRDKIAATRRKGKWSGGMPLLGYDVDPKGSKLIVQEAEAALVRAIFALYLEKRSLRLVLEELDRRGWLSKRWQTRKGRERGGRPLTKSSLHHLLCNVTYRGQIRYKKEVHAGEHAAIVDPITWQGVQELLRNQNPAPDLGVHASSGALLRGLLRCRACGSAMTPTHAYAHSRKYHYYVCIHAQKRGVRQCPARSLPAVRLEGFVLEQLRRLGQEPRLWQEHQAQARQQERSRLAGLDAEKLSWQTELLLGQEQIRQLLKQTGKVRDGGTDGTCLARLATLQEQVNGAKRQLTANHEEIRALREGEIDPAEMSRAMAWFSAAWESLTAAEQTSLLRRVLQRVVYDGDNVSLTVDPQGIKKLAAEYPAPTRR